MDMETAMTGQEVGKSEIDRELRRHDCEPAEFWTTWTKKRAPNSRDVLEFLGY